VADDLPSGIDLARHRDFEGRHIGQWLRHGFLILLTAFIVAALFNVFGQSSTISSATSPQAALTMTTPHRVRGGLLYQAKFEIHAVQELKEPVLVLNDGWFDQTTINAVEPEPAGATSDGGRVKYRFSPLQAGRTMTVYIDLQANPTNVGSHDATVALYDGDRRLLEIDHTQFNFP
jgi:hypothetical protein